jgi:thioredoxin-like negative regulator of GroEL
VFCFCIDATLLSTQQLYRKVEADPTDPFLVTALAYADVSLGRKEEGLQEARRAMEIRPISKDALNGPDVAAAVAQIYAMTGQPDTAFEQLNILIKIPSGFINYGDLKTNSWLGSTEEGPAI